LLRCANTGVTAAIDTTGSIAHPTSGKPQAILGPDGKSFVRDTLLADVNIPLSPSVSPYSIIGDWGILLLSFIGFGSAVVNRRLRGKSTAPQND
jgi:apolipoprotein N-acyltransferase